MTEAPQAARGAPDDASHGPRAESSSRLPWWALAGVALAGVGVDQACKQIALARLDPARPVSLLGGLVRLELTRNPGAAFSMGEGVTVVFAVAAILALAAVVVFVVPRLTSRLQGVVVAVLMAGIAGNLVDRLVRPPRPFHGYVVDFIGLPHFAIVNVADIFITCAAVLIGVHLVFFAPPRRAEETPS
ncbi:MAG: signal peptidase II [Actinomycetia bacterium]|nr:signal peptidase II [Actinomycetes bacterium]